MAFQKNGLKRWIDEKKTKTRDDIKWLVDEIKKIKNL